jgi:hypothetical protein
LIAMRITVSYVMSGVLALSCTNLRQKSQRFPLYLSASEQLHGLGC